jgi:hypothetical protein
VNASTNATKVRRAPWRTALAATTLMLASMLSVVVVAAPAQARCERVNVPITMTLSRPDDGALVASERANSGTCDGLGDYFGRLCDDLVDGQGARLFVYKHEGGALINDWYIGGGGQCTNVSFTEGDRNAWFVLRVGDLWVPRNSSGF